MLLEHLKTTTAEAHRRLEASLDWQAPSFTLADYRRLLRRIRGFLQPWEAATARQLGGEALAMFDERRKAPALERDLQALGDDLAAPVALAGPAELPTVDSAAKAWGSWYVIEGSTLGGQILVRRFRLRWNLADDRGLAYFAGYGDQTAARWAEFRSRAEASVAPEDYEAAASAALETFEKFGAWLNAPAATTDVVADRRNIAGGSA